VGAKFHQAKCTRYQTTVDFDREYLWNGSSNRQAENSAMIYDFATFWKLRSTHEKNDFDLWPMTLKFNRVLEVIEVNVLAKFRQAECSSSW